MNKRILGVIYLLLFFAMLLSGVATMPFIKQDGAAEKRILAEFPKLRDEEGKLNIVDFPRGFEDWLDDHIGLRMVWMQQYAKLHAALGSSVNDQVVVGEDGWLYFEPTVADFTGAGALTENERWRVKYTLEALDRTLNKPLVVFFAPNKNTVYPENMPALYPKTQDAHAMKWLIENADVEIIDSVSLFTGEGLYHVTDTHWNAKGARIGAAAIIDRVNALTGAQGIAPDPNAAFVEEAYTGDLGQMLFPGNPPQDVQLAYADAVQNYDHVGRYRTPEDMTIRTEGQGAPLKVLMLRDSFTNLLIEPISNAYSDVQYRRAMPLPLSDADAFDVVVLEMVERRIGELLTGMPVILAARAEAFESAEPNCAAEVYAQAGEERTLIYGKLDSAVDRLTRIRVGITAGGRTECYEALPVSGDESMSGDGCFALYVPELPQNAQIQVCMEGETALLSEITAAVIQ